MNTGLRSFYIVTVMLIISLMQPSCQTSKKSAGAGDASFAPADTRNPEKCDFVVSFISKGEGIDQDAMDSYQKMVDEFRTKHPGFETTIIPWGREGETDYCIMLSSLKKNDRSDFIEKSEHLLAGKPLVITKTDAVNRFYKP